MKRAPRPTRRERRLGKPVPEGEPIMLTPGGHVPVPFVASWSSEMPDFKVAPEPLLGGALALFRGAGRRGDGRPVLGKMDAGRQRLCFIRGLCQVCARPIEDVPWYALMEERADLVDGRPAFAVREPPSCTACMVLSLRVCPGLQRIRPRIIEAGKVTMLVTRTIPPIGGYGPLLPDGPELADPDPDKCVAGYLKAAIVNIRRAFQPDKFVDIFGRIVGA